MCQRVWWVIKFMASAPATSIFASFAIESYLTPMIKSLSNATFKGYGLFLWLIRIQMIVIGRNDHIFLFIKPFSYDILNTHALIFSSYWFFTIYHKDIFLMRSSVGSSQKEIQPNRLAALYTCLKILFITSLTVFLLIPVLFIVASEDNHYF